MAIKVKAKETLLKIGKYAGCTASCLLTKLSLKLHFALDFPRA